MLDTMMSEQSKCVRMDTMKSEQSTCITNDMGRSSHEIPQKNLFFQLNLEQLNRHFS